ncbi:MAG: hypothetical protein ACYDHW_12245 [Syntrophorhabdaceae bacterium]
MDKAIISEKIKPHVTDGKISCQQARKFAEDENIPYQELGDLLNELKIKIAGCQLGCF